MNKEELINFEHEVVELFNDGKLKSPIHLSGGNEGQLIEIFNRINKNDWVFSTYRSHYHALLHGIDKEWLKNWILDNKSIHVMNSEHKFWTSAIVGGTLPIALGVAMGINIQTKDIEAEINESNKGMPLERNAKLLKGEMPHVWCFVGDMTGHSGIFWEVIKYAHYHHLPITFVIEDNGLSTDTPTNEAWGINNKDYFNQLAELFPGRIVYYKYERKWPHYGSGKFVAKIWEGIDETKQKGF